MAKVAVFCSGSGTNFEAIAKRVAQSNHTLELMVCDRKHAGAFERAQRLGIESYYLTYVSRTREEAEKEIAEILKSRGLQLIVLAGYMRLLTPCLIDSFPRAIVNIHPALLPKYPGTDGIGDSYRSGDKELGITIHYVDYGMDTGPVIVQDWFERSEEESYEAIESKIHQLEYKNYPETVIGLLDAIENQ